MLVPNVFNETGKKKWRRAKFEEDRWGGGGGDAASTLAFMSWLCALEPADGYEKAILKPSALKLSCFILCLLFTNRTKQLKVGYVKVTQ